MLTNYNKYLKAFTHLKKLCKNVLKKSFLVLYNFFMFYGNQGNDSGPCTQNCSDYISWKEKKCSWLGGTLKSICMNLQTAFFFFQAA